MLKKIWTTIAVLAIVLVLAGLICGVVGVANGGSYDSLMENYQAAFVLDWLRPANLISALFGA